MRKLRLDCNTFSLTHDISKTDLDLTVNIPSGFAHCFLVRTDSDVLEREETHGQGQESEEGSEEDQEGGEEEALAVSGG
ncbi:MAG: hypothetical protein ABWZ74_05805 [Hyphomicrobiaceae bacterium]|jgi:hypothetical protein